MHKHSRTAAASAPADGRSSSVRAATRSSALPDLSFFTSGDLAAESDLSNPVLQLLQAQVKFNKNQNSFAHLSTNGYAEITANILIYQNSLNMSFKSSETV